MKSCRLFFGEAYKIINVSQSHSSPFVLKLIPICGIYAWISNITWDSRAWTFYLLFLFYYKYLEGGEKYPYPMSVVISHSNTVRVLYGIRTVNFKYYVSFNFYWGDIERHLKLNNFKRIKFWDLSGLLIALSLAIAGEEISAHSNESHD